MLQNVLNKTITDVNYQYFNSDSKKYFDIIQFYFDDMLLSITVDENTDDLIIKTEISEKNRIKKAPDEPIPSWYDEFIGKKIYTFWLGKNDINTFDLLILGINEIFPKFCIYSAASQLIFNNINIIE